MNKTIRRIISVFILMVFLSMAILPYSVSFAGDYPYKELCWNDGAKDDGEGGDNPGSGAGADPTYCDDEGEPVNLFTGNFKYKMQDIFVPARGIPLEFRRYYNSKDVYDGPFGRGWSHGYNIQLYELQDGADSFVMLRNYDGTTLNFKHLGGADYQTVSEHSFEELKKYTTFPSDLLAITPAGLDGGFCLRKKHGTEYLFNFNGQLRMIVDRNRNKLTLDYDAFDRLSSITDTTGRMITLAYNSSNKISLITDFTGRKFSYFYNSDGNLRLVKMPESVNHPDGVITEYTYDENNRLDLITDPNGNVYLENMYDEDGRVIEQRYGSGTFKFSYEFLKTTFKDCNGNVTEYYFNSDGTTYEKIRVGNFSGYIPISSNYPMSYEYNANKQVTRTILPRGNVIDKEYDEKGNILRIIRRPNQYSEDTDSIITVMTYDPEYNMVKTITDSRANTTTFNYDGLGNLTQIVYPQVDGVVPVVDFTYTQYGELETVTDPNSIITRFEYYPSTGYLQKVINNYGATIDNSEINFIYDDLGNVINVTDARGNSTTFEYDELNNLTRALSSAPFNYETLFEYDDNGNLIRLKRQADAGATNWQITEYEYDAKDMLIAVKQYTDDINYLLTKYVYDDNGNRTEVIDPEGNHTFYVYDSRDLLQQVIDEQDNVTTYSYDGNENLSNIKDARGNETQYAYDMFDRMTRIIYPDASTEHYEYDKNSNIAKKTFRDASNMNYEYDALNRLTKKIYPDSSDISFVYDAASRLISVTSRAAQVTNYTYDNLNRVTSVGYGQWVLDYEYDAMGNRTKLTYPDSEHVTYVYDELNRLSTIEDQTMTQIAAFTYDVLSRRSSLSYANGKQTTYQYDNLNRLTSVLCPQSSDFSYTYDNAGNRTSMTVNGSDVHNYTYDNIYQLSAVDYPDTYSSVDTSYTYDKLGNRETMLSSATTNYSTNTFNQYTVVGGYILAYDYNGNMTDDGTNTYEYDYENRLIKATNADNIIEYEYDAFGRRVSKKLYTLSQILQSTVYYVYDGDQVIAEYDGNNQLLRKYVYGDGIDEPVQVTSFTSPVAGKYYYHADGLGSIVALKDASGAVVESYEYDAFGEVSILNANRQTLSASQIGNPYMFTGRRLDSETGIYYYRARYYSPELGRFLQTDPVGYGDSMNLYQYCLNNPVNWIDPYGLDVWHIVDKDGVTHAGAVVGQDGYYTYHSFAPKGKSKPKGKGQYDEKAFDTFEKAMDYARGKGYDEYAIYRTGKCADEKAREAAREWEGSEYNFEAHNCQHMVNDMMWGAGVPWVGRGFPVITFNENKWTAEEYGMIE